MYMEGILREQFQESDVKPLAFRDLRRKKAAARHPPSAA
jgi:hypothetical protein